MNIIAVDDSRTTLDALCEALQETEAVRAAGGQPHITRFTRAQEALTALLAPDHPADLLVTDIAMPGMDGLTLTYQVLQRQMLPVVLHTGTWTAGTVIHAMLNGGLRHNPISVVGKPYPQVHESHDAYVLALSAAIDEAQAQSQSLTSANPDLLLPAIRELRRGSHQVQMHLDIAYRELRDTFIARAQEYGRDDLTEVGWHFTADTTLDYLHEMRKPVSVANLMLRMNRDEIPDPVLTGLLARMRELNDAVGHAITRYSPGMGDVMDHKRDLRDAALCAWPLRHPPAKLAGRTTDEHRLILRPGDDYDPDAAAGIISLTGQAIARSLHPAEDAAGLPLAGVFTSVVFDTVTTGQAAVAIVRETAHPLLEPLSRCRGMTPPQLEDMHVGIEPYHDTTYLGSIIEHPNQQGTYLIEYGMRYTDADHSAALLDARTGAISAQTNPPSHAQAFHLNALLDAAASRYQLSAPRFLREVARREGSCQMEFAYELGADPDAPGVLHEVQMRYFRPFAKLPAVGERFPVKEPLATLAVFGATPPEGIICAVTSSIDPYAVHLLGERAHAEGYAVCYRIDERAPDDPDAERLARGAIASIATEHLGLVVTGKGLATLAHAHFNPLAAAPNALLMLQEGMNQLGLEDGALIRYTSNGVQARVDILEQSDMTIAAIADVMARPLGAP